MNTLDKHPYLDILLVEDNAGDVFLINQCLQNSTNASYYLHRVEDGQEATDFLEKNFQYTNAPRPDLIILDLNLPRKDGRELLSELKTDPDFKTIPIIILTASSASNDVSQAYQLHANCYVVKPSTLNGLRRTIQSIEHFWLHCVQLPIPDA